MKSTIDIHQFLLSNQANLKKLNTKTHFFQKKKKLIKKNLLKIKVPKIISLMIRKIWKEKVNQNQIVQKRKK